MTDQEANAQEAKVEKESEESRDYDSEIKDLRGEAANWRVKLRDAEARVESLAKKLKGYEDANKSELERLAEEKAALERDKIALEEEVKTTVVNAEIIAYCVKEGVIDPDIVTSIVDRSEISYDGGRVTGVDKAVKKLLKEKPYLAKPESTPPAPGQGGKPITEGPDSGMRPADKLIYRGLKSAQKR